MAGLRVARLRALLLNYGGMPRMTSQWRWISGSDVRFLLGESTSSAST
jgi:hypothetical protein